MQYVMFVVFETDDFNRAEELATIVEGIAPYVVDNVSIRVEEDNV